MEAIQGILNFFFRPEILLALSILVMWAFYKYRKLCTQNTVMSAIILGFPIVFFALSAMEENFWIQFKRLVPPILEILKALVECPCHSPVDPHGFT